MFFSSIVRTDAVMNGHVWLIRSMIEWIYVVLCQNCASILYLYNYIPGHVAKDIQNSSNTSHFFHIQNIIKLLESNLSNLKRPRQKHLNVHVIKQMVGNKVPTFKVYPKNKLLQQKS